MVNSATLGNVRSHSVPTRGAVQTVVISVLCLLAFTTSSQAQTFRVIYDFIGANDGGPPEAGLTLDRAGNLYGTGWYINDKGYENYSIFVLKHGSAGWSSHVLYRAPGTIVSRVVFGPDGALYGNTESGGQNGLGTVFNLKPPMSTCTTTLCPWTSNTLYNFQGWADGRDATGDLTFDAQGNIVGTTEGNGNYPPSDGTVFKLMHSGGSWTEDVVYAFRGGNDGSNPFAGVALDHDGNIYGSTFDGGARICPDGNGCGIVFEFIYSEGQWTESVLHTFSNGMDGGYAAGGVIRDEAGNLYGTTIGLQTAGPCPGGTVFEMSPASNGWNFQTLHSFLENTSFLAGPWRSLTRDAGGNLYGTTAGDGLYGNGSVFKLTPSNGNWIFTSLYDFTGGSDGGGCYSNVTMDGNGNLYGTTSRGGAYGNGVAWEITP